MDKEERIKHATDQLIRQGNLNFVDNFFTADYIAHAEDSNHKGHEFIKQFASLIRSAIPDISVLKVELLDNSGNIIADNIHYMALIKLT